MRHPRLLEPLLVVSALADIFRIAGAIVAKIVVVAQRLDVGPGVVGSRAENVVLIRELGQHGALLIRAQDVPSLGEEKDGLFGEVSTVVCELFQWEYKPVGQLR